MCVCVYIHVYIYIHTTVISKTAEAMPPKKPSSDNLMVRHGFHAPNIIYY